MDKEGFVLEAQPCFNKFFQQKNNSLVDDVTRDAILEDVIEIIEIQEEDKTATEVSEDLDKKLPAVPTVAAEDLDKKPPAVPTVPAEVQVGATETKSFFVPIKNPYVTLQKATGVKSPGSASATPLSLHDIVVEAMNDQLFVETHSFEARKTTPPLILAIARHVAQATEMWFPTNTMKMIIPVHRISGAPLNPY